MAREAYLKKVVNSGESTMDYTTTDAETEGQVVKKNISSTQAVAGVTIADIAALGTGRIDVDNIYAIKCSSAQAFAEGAIVYWDYEGSQAVPAASANGADDFCIGTCMKTRATTDSAYVRVRLNWGPSEFVRNASSSSSSSST